MQCLMFMLNPKDDIYIAFLPLAHVLELLSENTMMLFGIKVTEHEKGLGFTYFSKDPIDFKNRSQSLRVFIDLRYLTRNVFFDHLGFFPARSQPLGNSRSSCHFI